MSLEPLSKNELYLNACCDGCGCTGLPEPLTRKEQLLYQSALDAGWIVKFQAVT